jgi:N-acetylmuramoyl-L-alanine amidase
MPVAALSNAFHRRLSHVLPVLLAAAVGACAPLTRERAHPEWVVPSVPVEQRASPSYDARRPAFVVLHHTSDNTAEQSLKTLTTRDSGVSAHYLVDRSGKVFYLVDERSRAWHAGASYWAGVRDLNSVSIGIELDNNGSEPYAEGQIAALLALLDDLRTRYRLPATAFIGHGDIAPGRKVDPSTFFPWRRLAQHGFGIWCDPPYPAAPGTLDNALLLQALGYNVWNLEATIAAFKRRFVPDDASPAMTEKDRSILYCLVLQQQTLAVQ